MNIRTLLLCMLFVAPFVANAQKRTIAGITFPAKITVNSKPLLYNGGGLREKYTLDLYVAALYLKRPSMDANKILADNFEQAIHITLVSNKVTSEKFVESVREGFKNASTGKASEAIINKFMDCFSDPIKKGDKIHIEYTPYKGTTIKINGVEKGTLGGFDFKKALFSIWLGTKPADSTLKKGMLGKV